MNITQIVEELESLAGSGTRMPGFRGKVMVDKDRLTTIASGLREAIPANVREAHEILRQKDSLLNLAAMEAQRIKESAAGEANTVVEAARKEHATKVDQTEIVKAAEAKAREITDHALQQANEIMQDAQKRSYRVSDESDATAAARRDGADQYAREVLFGLEERLSQLLGQVRRGIDALGVESGTTAGSNRS